MKEKYLFISMLAGILLSYMILTGSVFSEDKGKRNFDMDLKKLKQRILRDQDSAMDLAEKIGKPAIPFLKVMFKETKGDQKCLVLDCLSVIQDKSLNKFYVKALDDSDSEIRIISLQNLNGEFGHEKKDGTIVKQLIEKLKSRHPQVRGGVAGFLGFARDKSALKPLLNALGIEKNKEARKELLLASAKLGDTRSLKKITANLKANNSRLRYQAVEDLRYVNNRKTAKQLLPLLDDHERGHVLAKDPHSIEYARICDSTVNLVAFMFDNPFSFEAPDYKKYSAQEIEEVRKFLKELKN